jgi:hypothetical protein
MQGFFEVALAVWSGAVICPPFGAVQMTAGPDGVRGSGPYQDYALLCASIYSGLPNLRLDRSPSLPLHPRILCGFAAFTPRDVRASFVSGSVY